MQGTTWPHFARTSLSGLIVGVIAIPLGMAFAIAAGVKPEYGIVYHYNCRYANFLAWWVQVSRLGERVIALPIPLSPL